VSKDTEEPVSVDNLVTWVFEEGTFRPAAKLIKGKAYSIITDYLGTPKEAYDWWANKVWAIELEAYGKVKSCEGWLGTPAEESFIPFRFQGQYHDLETGLYYNRFRYYSPEEGMYVTAQDPIGLQGCSLGFYKYVGDTNQYIDSFSLSQTYWLEKALEAAGRPLRDGQTAHHIVQQNNASRYAQLSRDILTRNGLSTEIAENGARLWGTSSSQVSQSGHPGRGVSGNRPGNYHGGTHIHSSANDKLIYKILKKAEKIGGEAGIRNALSEIGEKMESGQWRNNFKACH
jgi:RHS repeat-associated protein